ncbi:hypothetical protein [Vibrio brasiliensis]
MIKAVIIPFGYFQHSPRDTHKVNLDHMVAEGYFQPITGYLNELPELKEEFTVSSKSDMTGGEHLDNSVFKCVKIYNDDNNRISDHQVTIWAKYVRMSRST